MGTSKYCQADCRICPNKEKSLFSHLSEADYQILNGMFSQSNYLKKQIIFNEGNPPIGLYCIRQGKIKLYKTNFNGKIHIFKIAQPGEVLGHAALFSNEPLNFTAEALEDTQLCFLDKNHFQNLLENNFKLALNFLSHMSGELYYTENAALNLAYESVRVRFVELLLTLKNSFGKKTSTGWILDVKLSREEMAQSIGSTEETVVRLIAELKKDHLIDVKHKEISIKNLNKLMELMSPAY